MKIKCEYCGSFISDTDEKCPNCGGTNSHLMRSADKIPKSVDELLAFCSARNMPLKKMRFFIGENCTEPRAFGIYREDDGDFIVYKNKSDGSRTVRYRGKDEAYAVNELYQKLHSEVMLRRKPADPAAVSGTGKKRRWKCPFSLKVLGIALAIFFVSAIIVELFSAGSPDSGYYYYNDDYYYYQNSDWYRYDDLDHWSSAPTVDETLSENYGDYWQSRYFSADYGIDSFEDSVYYSVTDESDWSQDWDDDDWDSDYDSWDSGDTDWDSDW